MGIQQINASYVADEDRVLLRVTTSQEQEYRLWLTRAVVAKFLEVSDKAVVSSLAKQHPLEQAQAIAEFKEDVLSEKENFAHIFKPVDDLPLGPEPKLVIGLNAMVERETCHMGLQLANQQTLTLHLGSDLLLKTKLLLKKISDQAHWFSLYSATHAIQDSVDMTSLVPKEKIVH